MVFIFLHCCCFFSCLCSFFPLCLLSFYICSFQFLCFRCCSLFSFVPFVFVLNCDLFHRKGPRLRKRRRAHVANHFRLFHIIPTILKNIKQIEHMLKPKSLLLKPRTNCASFFALVAASNGTNHGSHEVQDRWADHRCSRSTNVCGHRCNQTATANSHQVGCVYFELPCSWSALGMH